MKKAIIILSFWLILFFPFVVSSYGQTSTKQANIGGHQEINDKRAVDSLYQAWNNFLQKQQILEAAQTFNRFWVVYNKFDTSELQINRDEMVDKRQFFVDTVFNIKKESLEKKEFDKAEQCFLITLELYQQLIAEEEEDPENSLSIILDTYNLRCASLLVDFGAFCFIYLEDDEKAEKYWLLAQDRFGNVYGNSTQIWYEKSIVFYNLGLLSNVQKKYDKAEEYYLHCLEMRKGVVKWDEDYLPNIVDVYVELTGNYVKQKKYAEAKEQIQHAVETIKRINVLTGDYNSVDVYGSLAWNSLFVGEYTQAEQFARQALAKDDTQTWIKVNLAHALLFQNRYSEAEKLYKAAALTEKQGILTDFDDLKAVGAIPKKQMPDVEKIKKIIQ